MNRRNFIRSTLAVSMLATLGAVGSAHAEIEEGKLVVWINGDKGYNGLQEVGDWFAEETGIPVEVAHPDSATDKFQQAAATGNGPDIFIWAHDRLGEWAQSGLIAELNPSQSARDANYDFTWDAVTVDGKVYGYPMAVESIGLIYNKDLVPEPPKTFEEIPALDKKLAEQGKKAILWDYNNTYFTWPLLAANGGYIFKETDNGYDVSDTGVNSEGAIKGAKMLETLIEQGVMPRGADYGAMDSRFNQGEVAMMINGPWAWANLKKSGIDFGVTTLPTIDGGTPEPMVGVMAATLNSASPNRALAVEFLENYALSVKGLKMVNDDVPLGAVANKELMEELSAANPHIEATFKNAEIGEPMPSVPAMGAFWSSMAPALQNITSGRQSVEEALDTAANRITR
ncbi:maltose/maltodextrin ABC transporter substrate-binding protein MalE [Marinobacter nanhaiticus D15-8W]|uniref:Maltodextrin-binding protein n=1 Tax=Marinobacter nanhaiticus D15-8W TaxID=626887 RepID=N6WQ34_9GAMM|nr:maltose/maltodextrin ABC transporter substrate-binding protein MalE [Marinobacter nanhaiticus]ENO13681.1 maltose/maltodextrin ABC transporter substrate-binding protein MalE [Marinobacter nanhaiticus D15-8W]BES71053.1 maltose/maltodextrin ABC transporter substrate-binding protein MalE [Marinobacter nanhaiticus D15-8W]